MLALNPLNRQFQAQHPPQAPAPGPARHPAPPSKQSSETQPSGRGGTSAPRPTPPSRPAPEKQVSIGKSVKTKFKRETCQNFRSKLLLKNFRPPGSAQPPAPSPQSSQPPSPAQFSSNRGNPAPDPSQNFRPTTSPAQHPIPKIKYQSENLLKTFRSKRFAEKVSLKTCWHPNPSLKRLREAISQRRSKLSVKALLAPKPFRSTSSPAQHPTFQNTVARTMLSIVGREAITAVARRAGYEGSSRTLDNMTAFLSRIKGEGRQCRVRWVCCAASSEPAPSDLDGLPARCSDCSS